MLKLKLKLSQDNEPLHFTQVGRLFPRPASTRGHSLQTNPTNTLHLQKQTTMPKVTTSSQSKTQGQAHHFIFVEGIHAFGFWDQNRIKLDSHANITSSTKIGDLLPVQTRHAVLKSHTLPSVTAADQLYKDKLKKQYDSQGRLSSPSLFLPLQLLLNLDHKNYQPLFIRL